MFSRQEISDDARLQLCKLSFPRRDLVSWVEDLHPSPNLPETFFPFMLYVAAHQIGVRHSLKKTVCCHSREMSKFFDIPARTTQHHASNWIIGDSGYIDKSSVTSPHEVGLLAGWFSGPADADAFQACKNADFYNAHLLFFFAGSQALWPPSDLQSPKHTQIYFGPFQHWGQHELMVSWQAPSNRSE